jgi:hypothetical protein
MFNLFGFKPTPVLSTTASTTDYELGTEQTAQVAQMQGETARLSNDVQKREAQIARLQNETAHKKAEIDAINEKLKKILHKRDQQLPELLAAKLPNIYRAIQCYIDFDAKKLNIYLIGCLPDQTKVINNFFSTALKSTDFVLTNTEGGDFGRIVAANQQVMSIQLALANRVNLINGLKRVNSAPESSFADLIMRR